MRINHLALVTSNATQMDSFLVNVAGLLPHRVDGWYSVPDSGVSVHVIEISEAVVPVSEDLHHEYRHIAMEVDSLRSVLAAALRENYTVFQMSMTGDERPVEASDDALQFGLRTIFVRDSDRNLWEFVQRGFSDSALFE